MNSREVTIARIYTLEGHDHLNQVLEILREEEKIIGVTAIRGIAGYGSSGMIHTSSLLTMSLELPIIIEFYDEADKVSHAIEKLKSRLNLKHIVSWPVYAHINSDS
jgi:PII-like signaling protein